MPALRTALLAFLAAPIASGCIIISDEDDDIPSDPTGVVVADRCPGDPAAWVEAASLDGDALVVTARYSGCGPTQIWACWRGLFLESNPVQVPLAIHHEPAGDCDALITETARIDLDRVLDAYDDRYGGQDRIIFTVGDFYLTWTP